ncbi:MAG: hypothetical protein GX201_14205, partial [Clostridiales bacterium]|nr:hypothetical protein [Clostridiales bacterium]
MLYDEIPFKNKKRIITIGIVFIFICFYLLCKLFYIQVIKNYDYSKKAVQQRLLTIPIEIERGNIYDKNMIPFTSRKIKKYIIVYPNYVQDSVSVASVISRLCNLNIDEILEQIKSDIDTLEFIYEGENSDLLDLIEEGKIKGVTAIEKKHRYSEGSIGRHVIGYISKSDKKGVMGIEKSMDNYLSSASGKSIIAVVDSSKNIIPGLGFRKVETNKDGLNYGVKLTL